ncbi:MAG: hypothetical protein ACC662_05150, partial [Planctomycetota bacterium]
RRVVEQLTLEPFDLLLRDERGRTLRLDASPGPSGVAEVGVGAARLGQDAYPTRLFALEARIRDETGTPSLLWKGTLLLVPWSPGRAAEQGGRFSDWSSVLTGCMLGA